MQIDKSEFFELMTTLFHQFLNDVNVTSFPGNLPISLQRSHLFLLAFGYIVTYKADGLRAFILICESHVFYIKRNMEFAFIGSIPNECDLYLFDAEIIEANGLILLFDTLIYKGLNTLRSDISQRNELAREFLSRIGIQEHILQKWETIKIKSNYESKTFFFNSGGEQNWKLQTKPLFSYFDLKKMWSLRTHLPYNCDGLVFYRQLCAYQPFRSDPMSLIKWKELDDITIDFLFVLPGNGKILKETDSKFVVKKGNVLLSTTSQWDDQPVFFSYAYVSEQELHEYKNKIVECRWNRDKENWQCIKLRLDKTSPNILSTVLETLKNIEDPIKFHDFILP